MVKLYSKPKLELLSHKALKLMLKVNFLSSVLKKEPCLGFSLYRSAHDKTIQSFSV